jgi:hypothetical protein
VGGYWNELGSLLDEGPSKLYDALSSVLGLEELLDVQSVLADARKIRQDQVKRTKDAAEAIRTRVANLPDAGTDSRLARASLLLQGESWDVAALRALIRDSGSGEDPDRGEITLEGTAQRRRVALQVTVDGSPAEALGVMSQGELHSLALSLFLPRATLPESPFRFMSIDDPVQSMDPARVEGLARTLADAARTRQVIVFTHDDRLPEAVRRRGLPATVIGVTRRARSVVEVRQISDLVRSLFDDARAVAMMEDLPASGPFLETTSSAAVRTRCGRHSAALRTSIPMSCRRRAKSWTAGWLAWRRSLREPSAPGCLADLVPDLVCHAARLESESSCTTSSVTSTARPTSSKVAAQA